MIEIPIDLELLGRAALVSFWLPLAAWTIVAGSAYALLQRRPPASSFTTYRAYQALLFALPLGLVLAALTDVSFPAWSDAASVSVGPFFAAMPSVSGGNVEAAVWTWGHSLGLATLLVMALAVWQTMRLGWQMLTLASLPRLLPSAPLDVQRQVARLARPYGVRKPIRVHATDQIDVPLTFGWRRPAIVVPHTLLDDTPALRLALAHELVHVRRRDYVWHGLERAVAALFAVHPFVHILVRRLTQVRELCCDAEVLAEPTTDRRHYATLLLRFATPHPAAPLALGMSDDASNLKTRILAMAHASPLSPRTRLSFTFGILLLALTTAFVACSDDVLKPNKAPSSAVAETDDVFMVVEEMPQLLPDTQTAFQALIQEIRYPRLAKEAGIEGRVFVEFIVDENGAVVNPTVTRGIGAGCDEEAVRAVQTLTFAPGKQRGQEVKVKMTLPITFKLPAEAPESS